LQPRSPEQPAQTPPDTAEPERLTDQSLALAFWPLWVLPFAGVGIALLLELCFPRSINNFYMRTVVPFGATFWLGTFFAMGWEAQRYWIQDLPRKWAPWVIGAALLAVLIVMGGPPAIIDDPWLAGIVLFPGVRMFLSYQKHRTASRM
jgi:hypothetical protein